MSIPRARRWCFTINNFSQEEEEAVMNAPQQDWLKCIIAEEEHLEEGTPHIQGYFETVSRVYMTFLKGYFGTRIHLEVAKGSTKQNWEYCTKEGNIIVEHNRPDTVDRRPHRSKTDVSAAQILEDIPNMTEDDFKEAHPNFYLRNRKLYYEHRLRALLARATSYNSDLHDKNLWIYGPPGTGKTTFALSGLPRYNVYQKCAKNKWWDEFDPLRHQRVVIEDFDPCEQFSTLPYYLKIWGDRHGSVVEIKGAGTYLDGHIPVIVTSNYSIDDCIPNPADRAAIKRRFREIYWDGSRIEGYSECPFTGHYLNQQQPNVSVPKPAAAVEPEPSQPEDIPEEEDYEDSIVEEEDSIVEEEDEEYKGVDLSFYSLQNLMNHYD
nr:MAG: replicase [Circovirus sp.]